MSELPPTPIDWRDRAGELARALADPDLDHLDTPAGRGAAHAVALGLGRCRLEGLVPADDGTLPIPIAIAAAQSLGDDLRALAADLPRLGERFDTCPEPREAEAELLGTFAVRHDSWAAFVALDEAYDAALAIGDPDAERLGTELDRLFAAFDAVDAGMLDEIALLAAVADCPWFAVTRAGLADEYRECPPWWLDGRVEREAGRNFARNAESTATIFGRPRVEPVAVVSGWLIPYREAVETTLALAASTAGTEPPPAPPVKTTWQSADGLVILDVRLAPAVRGVRLAFFDTRDDRDLAGTDVVIDGIPLRLAAHGRVEVPLDRFAGADSAAAPRVTIAGVSELFQPRETGGRVHGEI